MAKSKTTKVETVKEPVEAEVKTVVEEKPEFVKIQSEVTINVTMGLNAQNVTNKDAHIPDRLKINPLWPKAMIQIKKGTFWYPAEITEWRTIKALANKGILTIGEFSTVASNDVVMEKKVLERKVEEVEKKSTSLEDIVDD